MSLSLVGLLVFQYFWMQESLKVEKNNFTASVGEAMQGVILQLEKKEVQHQMQQNVRRKALLQRIDSVNTNINLLLKQNPDLLFEESVQEIAGLYTTDESGSLLLQPDTTVVHDAANAEETPKKEQQNRAKIRRVRKSYQQLRHQKEQLIHKLGLMDELYQEVMSYSSSQPLEQRIHPKELDTLIAKNLRLKHINVPVEWGLFNVKRSKLIIQRTGKYSKQLLDSPYIYSLSTANTNASDDYLIAYFPTERHYLFSQVQFLLIASFCLFAIIIFVFVYILRKIIQQRKWTENRNDFINNLTHEIKTPVSTISLVCEALGDESIRKSDAMLEKYIDVIRQENKRLSSLSEQILQLARLEHQHYRLFMSINDVHAMIKEAVELMKLQVTHRGGNIELQLNAENDEILADHTHFINMLTNLIDNANKYSPQAPEITIKTRNIRHGIEVCVSDKGIGIHTNQIKKIFDNLYRVSTGNIHDVKGFGLGLSYVKKVVDKHSGKIKVESEVKKGTTFHLIFPLITKEK